VGLVVTAGAAYSNLFFVAMCKRCKAQTVALQLHEKQWSLVCGTCQFEEQFQYIREWRRQRYIA